MTKPIPLGRVKATPAALDAIVLAGQEPSFFLNRHAVGDWGDACPDDRQANEDALRYGDRLLSIYKTLQRSRIYIITEADRSSTTIMLPEEY